MPRRRGRPVMPGSINLMTSGVPGKLIMKPSANLLAARERVGGGIYRRCFVDL